MGSGSTLTGFRAAALALGRGDALAALGLVGRAEGAAGLTLRGIAYAQIVKPVGARFMVAVRPARGWCRVEALAPLFSTMQPPEIVT